MDVIKLKIIIIFLLIKTFLACFNPLSYEEKLKFKKAILEKDIDYVKIILNKKLDINNDRIFGYVPFHIAVKSNDIELVKIFLDYGADINRVDEIGENCLFKTDNIDLIKYLIKKGANVNQKNYLGSIPLESYLYNINLVKILVENGSNINNIDNYGYPLIFSALRYDDFKLIKYLIEKGVNIKVYNTRGENCLIVHGYTGYDIKIVDILIQKGLEINYVSKTGLNVLLSSILSSFKFKEKNLQKNYFYIKHLINKGININHQDKLGNTALHYTVIRERPIELLSLLLKYGARKDIHNNEGKTPLDIAIEKKDSKMIEMLK